MITVSIIVPVYNVENYLSKCLDSLIHQSLTSIEIIVINDGSTDQSGEIAKNYAQKDHRIRLFHQSNMGLSLTRNRGLKEAKGEYIVFVDSDDWLCENAIEQLYKEAISTQTEMVVANAVFIYPDGRKTNPYQRENSLYWDEILNGKECFCKLMRNRCFDPMASSYLYKRELIEVNKLNFSDILHEDELWTPVAMCHAKRISILDLDFYFYRQRSGSIVHSKNRKERFDSLILCANELALFAEKYTFNEEKELKSWIYVKVFELYAFACEILPITNNLDINFSKSLLKNFPEFSTHLARIQKNICLQYYRRANYAIKIYKKRCEVKVQYQKSSKIKVLIFNKMWSMPLPYTLKDIPQDFMITTDRGMLNEVDAVVFHLPSLFEEMEEDVEKKDGQIWIAWNLECEINRPLFNKPEITELFDLWMSYHSSADIIYPYYKYDFLYQFKQPEQQDKINKACMFISSAINNSGRIEYLRELMQYTPIDSFGHILQNSYLKEDNGVETKMEMIAKYKFTIAFENAIANDYVTEKFFEPLQAGSVPVYLGAPNIMDYVPSYSAFVDATDFSSPKDLAEFMNQCYKDKTLYDSLLSWKERPFLPSFVKLVKEQKVNPFTRLCFKIKESLDRQKNDNSVNSVPTDSDITEDVYFCSFGDSHYANSRERITFQATQFEIFKNLFIYSEHDLDVDFRNRFKSQLKLGSKGYGYWVWKPFLILKCLEKIRDNDILLYLDIGCHLNIKGKNRFFHYLEKVRKNKLGILVTQLDFSKPEKFWTKGDLLDFLQVRYRFDILSSPQYQGGILLIRKNNEAISIIKKWLDVFYTNFNLVDDSPSISTNIEGFIEHRNDQSVISLLLKKSKAATIPVDEVYNEDWDRLDNYPIWARRDRQ